jgi:hypothetical protein
MPNWIINIIMYQLKNRKEKIENHGKEEQWEGRTLPRTRKEEKWRHHLQEHVLP